VIKENVLKSKKKKKALIGAEKNMKVSNPA
jgi:hypothetical protein